MRGLERLAVENTTGPLTLVLDAQEYAQGFYASLGYERTPRERFLDARIWHVEMAKQVNRGGAGADRLEQALGSRRGVGRVDALEQLGH